jgi:hypothetical protein
MEVEAWSALFVGLINHRTTILFSQNKPATSNQPTIVFLRTNEHQPLTTSQTNKLSK